MTDPILPTSSKAILPSPAQEASYNKKIESMNRLTRLFYDTLKAPEHANIESTAISLVSDQNSQTEEFCQVVSGFIGRPSEPVMPLTLYNYSSLVKAFTTTLGFASELTSWTKKQKKIMTVRNLQLLQSASYAMYNIFRSSALLYGVATTFKPSLASTAFSTATRTASSHLLSIFSVVRAALSSISLYRAYKVKSLCGRVQDLGSKLKELKESIQVSTQEIEKAIGKSKKSKNDFFESYYQTKLKTLGPELMKYLALSKEPDLKGFEQAFSQKEFKDYLSAKLNLDKRLVEGLSSQAFLGLLIFKQDKTSEKEQAFIKSVFDSETEGVEFIKLLKSTYKMSELGKGLVTPAEIDQATKQLFEKLETHTHRKIIKEWVVIASCVLTVVALSTALFCPPTAGILGFVAALWILSNAMEYGLSLREFGIAGKLAEDPTGKDRWKRRLAIAINVLVVGLCIASLAAGAASPVGAPMVIGSIVALVLYSAFNAAVYNKSLRKKLVAHADYIDRKINQRFANLFKAPIVYDSTELKSNLEDYKKRSQLDKILKLPLERKKQLLSHLRMDINQSRLFRVKNGRYQIVAADQIADFLKTYEGQKQLEAMIDAKILANFESSQKQILEGYKALKKTMLSETLKHLEAKPKSA